MSPEWNQSIFSTLRSGRQLGTPPADAIGLMRCFRPDPTALGITLLEFATMSTTAADEPKNEEKQKPDWGLKESYTLKVTVRHWSGSMFLNPFPDVPACLTEIGGKTAICTIPGGASNAETPRDSTITLPDGTVYVITSAKTNLDGKNFRYSMNFVQKNKPERP
jgi:hypothetical protein